MENLFNFGRETKKGMKFCINYYRINIDKQKLITTISLDDKGFNYKGDIWK